MLPFFQGEIKCFTSGFIIERVDQHSCVPLVINFAEHVQHVQIIDFKDCLDKITSMFGCTSQSLSNSDLNGFLIVYTLKSIQTNEHGITYTAADKSFPNVFGESCTQIALCIRYVDRASAMISNLLDYWKASYRLHDIEELKGKDQVLSKEIISSFVSLIHQWILQQPEILSNRFDLKSFTSVPFGELYALFSQLTYGSPDMASVGLR
jgi:hypothetical protein